MTSSLLPHEPYPLHFLFPSLHTLTLPLDTAESVIELFTILQTNTTLKALSVKIKEERVYTSSMGTSLQDMLTQNQTLKYLEINHWHNDIPSSFLSFLTTGLRHNTSLQQLSVLSIPLNEIVTLSLKRAISQKLKWNFLWQTTVNLRKNHCFMNRYYLLLLSHTTIRLLTVWLILKSKH